MFIETNSELRDLGVEAAVDRVIGEGFCEQKDEKMRNQGHSTLWWWNIIFKDLDFLRNWNLDVSLSLAHAHTHIPTYKGKYVRRWVY